MLLKIIQGSAVRNGLVGDDPVRAVGRSSASSMASRTGGNPVATFGNERNLASPLGGSQGASHDLVPLDRNNSG